MFALKKFIAFFLNPMNIGLLLGFIGLYYLIRKRQRRANIVLVTSFVWIALIHYAPLSNAIIQPLEEQHAALITPPQVAYIHVLGNAHHSNDKLSVISQNSKTALSRLNEAIRLYHKIPHAKMITSGYGGDDKVSQAMMQKRTAIALGVPKEDIITLPEPRDTREEALALKKLIADKRFILVTSAAHMPRAVALFKKAGLDPIPAPTDHRASSKNSWISFSSGALERTTSAFHEYIGLLYYSLRGFI
jgi:uncharacterized SAM-binding protein YcdF (DUF218 family)